MIRGERLSGKSKVQRDFASALDSSMMELGIQIYCPIQLGKHLMLYPYDIEGVYGVIERVVLNEQIRAAIDAVCSEYNFKTEDYNKFQLNESTTESKGTKKVRNSRSKSKGD